MMTEYWSTCLSSRWSRLTGGFPHTVRSENISSVLYTSSLIFNPTDTSCRRTFPPLIYHRIPSFQHSYDKRLSFIADVRPGRQKQIWNGDWNREALRQQNAVFELRLMTFWDELLHGGQPELSSNAGANANASSQDSKQTSSSLEKRDIREG